MPIYEHGTFDMTGSGITFAINLMIGTFQNSHISKTHNIIISLCNGLSISILINFV